MLVVRLVKLVPTGTVIVIILLTVSITPVASGVTILNEVICLPVDIVCDGLLCSFLHALENNIIAQIIEAINLNFFISK